MTGTSTGRGAALLSPAAIALGACLPFVSALGFGFVNWDDATHLWKNPAVTGGGSWHDVLLTPNLGYPIPVSTAVWRGLYAVVGQRSGPYHALNLALHAGVVALVVVIGRRLGLGRAGAAVAGALFGLHPVVAEPVSWVTGGKDLLATLLALLAALAFLHDRAGPGRGRWIALYALAALAKPSVLSLPCGLWFLSRPWVGRGQAFRTILPGLLVALAIGAVGLLGQLHVGAVAPTTGPTAALRLAWYALGYSLRLLVGLEVWSPKHIPAAWPPGFEAGVDLFPLVAAAGLLTLASALPPDDRARARRALVFAGLAYLPVSGLVPLKRFLAESYLYWPLVGLAWAAGAAVEGLARRLPGRGDAPGLRRGLLAGLGVAVALFLAVRTHAASAKWRDGVTLWSAAMRQIGDSPEICRNLGNAHVEQGDPERGLQVYRLCAGRFGADKFERNIALTLFILGRRDEARAAFRAIAERRPDDPVAARYLPLLGP